VHPHLGTTEWTGTFPLIISRYAAIITEKVPDTPAVGLRNMMTKRGLAICLTTTIVMLIASLAMANSPHVMIIDVASNGTTRISEVTLNSTQLTAIVSGAVAEEGDNVNA
jgi:hypothetical protein